MGAAPPADVLRHAGIQQSIAAAEVAVDRRATVPTWSGTGRIDHEHTLRHRSARLQAKLLRFLV